MKNIINGIKENKNVIIKRGLILGAAIAGLTLIGKAFSTDEEDYYEGDLINCEDDEMEDHDETTDEE